MKPRCIALVICAFLFAPSLSMAADGVPLDTFKAANFALTCSDQHREFKHLCVGYITGAIDAFRTTTLLQANAGVGGFPYDFCIPPHVNADDLPPVIVDYMLRHPEIASEDAFVLIYSAIVEKWQCD